MNTLTNYFSFKSSQPNQRETKEAETKEVDTVEDEEDDDLDAKQEEASTNTEPNQQQETNQRNQEQSPTTMRISGKKRKRRENEENNHAHRVLPQSAAKKRRTSTNLLVNGSNDSDDDVVTQIIQQTQQEKRESEDAQNRNQEDIAQNRVESSMKWKCVECGLEQTFVGGKFATMELRKFIHRFVCANCRDGMEQVIKDEMDKQIRKKKVERYSITYKCIHRGCKEQRVGKIWAGKNAYVNWRRHYLQHHPDQEFLDVMKMKLCDERLCDHVVEKDVRFCDNHKKARQEEKKQENDQERNEWQIIDGDGQLFDVRRCLRYVDMVEAVDTDQQRSDAVEIMGKAMDVIASNNASLAQKLNASVKMRLFGPTMYYVPFRGNDTAHNKQEMMKRRKLFNGNQWQALMDRIEYEQNKIDAKMNRRKNKELQEESKMNEERKAAPDLQQELAQIQTSDLLSSWTVPNGASGDINKELLAQRIKDIQYGRYEDKDQIERKLRRCIKLIEQGKYKKADQALNDGSIADVARNGNFEKLRKKFPMGNKWKATNETLAPKMKLKYDEAVKILENIKANAAAGKIVVDNNVILWAMKRDKHHAITHSLYRFAKYWMECRVPEQIRKLMVYSKGVPLGKEKHGIADYDIRPVVMFDSIMRIVDRLIICSISRADRKKLMGPYQVIGEKAACEKATFAVDYALELQDEDEDLVLIAIDAVNAYNSYDRERVYQLILRKEPNLAYYFENIYADDIEIDFDRNTRIKMTKGGVQGLNSTELFYGMMKWEVQQKVLAVMKEQCSDFKKVCQIDYVDDGIDMMHYKFAPQYIREMEQEYKQWGIDINIDKTEIIAKTQNAAITTFVRLNLSQFKFNFQGNVKILGIPHGTDQFVMENMDKLFMKLQRKLLHIQLINNTFMRMKMLRKFMDYNKIIYNLKLTRRIEQWITNMDTVYKFVQRSILNHIEYVPTMKYQSMLSRRLGGLGLRAPKFSYLATRITAIFKKYDKIDCFFNVGQDEVNQSANQSRYQQVIAKKKRQFQHEVDEAVEKFNQQIGPNLFLRMNSNIQHRDLLALLDKKLLEQYYEVATDVDIARIKSLGVNGASSWLDITPNVFYGVTFTNQEFWVALSLYMGADIDRRSKLCAKCKEPMDVKGHHGLHCRWKSCVIDRHNAIRNELRRMMEEAGKNTKIEQKYIINKENGSWYEIPGIPGDLVVDQWNTEEAKEHYFDVVVGNVCAPSWIPLAKQKRLAVATKKENIKREKYPQIPNFTPLAIETMGGMGDAFKKVLQRLAEITAFRKAKKKELVINQLRKKIIAVLMKKNVECILSTLQM